MAACELLGCLQLCNLDMQIPSKQQRGLLELLLTICTVRHSDKDIGADADADVQQPRLQTAVND